MDSRSGKKSDGVGDKILKADSWASYKLRSARKSSRITDGRLVDESELAASNTDLSETESEGTRTSRSSPRHVSSVMEKFCEGKKKAIREIGLGGLLHLALINKVNLKFTLWVLSRIDVKSRSMPVGRDGRVFLCTEHLEKVLGVPSRGRQICGLEPDNAQERTDFVRLAMGASQHCNNPLKAAQSVVMRQWKDDVSNDIVDEFKSSIGVRYYLDHMMDAAARLQADMKLKKATMVITSCPLLVEIIYLDNIDLGILSKPHTMFPRILDFDSESLINKMIMGDMLPKHPEQGESVWGAAKARTRQNSCYMASETSSGHVRRAGKEIETPSNSMEVKVGSRFSASILRPVTASDFCQFLKQEYPDMMGSDMGIVDYLKIHNARCIMHSNIFKDSIIRENMRLAARLLDKHKHPKLNTKSPVRGREDYWSAGESDTDTNNKQTRLNKNRRPVSCWPNIPTMNSVGASTATRAPDEAYPSFDLGSFSPEKLVIEQTPEKQQVADPVIHGLTVNEDNTMTTPASKIDGFTTPHSSYTENVIYSECALAGKWDTSPKFLNLNARALAADYSDSPITKRQVIPGKFARSPWAMGVKHPSRDHELTHSLHDWISSTGSTELEWAWFVHNNPRYIEIQGFAMKRAITGVECWGYDVFDLAIRRIQQLDRGMYPVGIIWRTILESDFAMHVLGNSNPVENIPVRSQLTGGGAEVEIHRCRQIIIPVRSPRSWCAFAWDMELQKTNILDTTASLATEDQTLEAHSLTIERLHAALANCVELLFDGWTPDWPKWSISVVKSDNLTPSIHSNSSFSKCSEQSALYTLFNIINFDGQKYAVEPTPEAINNFKEKMLYEMMSIEDNKGKVPSMFVHTIED